MTAPRRLITITVTGEYSDGTTETMHAPVEGAFLTDDGVRHTHNIDMIETYSRHKMQYKISHEIRWTEIELRDI